MIYLLDVSTLLALLWDDHQFHAPVKSWQHGQSLAVCPITELGFLRISTQAFGARMEESRQVLSAWLEARQPLFVPCDARALDGVKAPTGGRTTDYYLANLAEVHGLALATLDERVSHSAVFVIPAFRDKR